jgi:endonuclease YncB( thermonuclease family)
MRWPWAGDEDDKKDRQASWADVLEPANWSWSSLTEPNTLIPSIVFTVTTVSALRIYKTYLRRIPSVNHIKPDYFRRRSLFGRVTSVGDADNFRLFHTPGGRIAGWGWLPWKRVPNTKKDLVNKTVSFNNFTIISQSLHPNLMLIVSKIPIRLAGIDAPELAHWGREAQPYSKEAHEWLIQYILNRRVRVSIYRRDQYDRVVAQVHIRKWLRKRDVGLEMLKTGLATVYEAKTGSEFGQFEQQYRDAEEKAKANKVGMWTRTSILGRLRGESTASLESPREYKNRHATAEKQKTS